VSEVALGYCVVTTDRWSILSVLLARVTHLGEVVFGPKHAAAEPHRVALHQILAYFCRHRIVSSRDLIENRHSFVKTILDLAF
jgi:hypothetical protein